MTKEKIPRTVEELFLVAENDRKFYDAVQPAAEQFFLHAKSGCSFRETVYKALNNLFIGYEGSAYQFVTSKAAVYFACRYAPDSKSREWCRARIIEEFPTYSIPQAMVDENEIEILVKRQDLMKDKASRVPTKHFLLDWVNNQPQTQSVFVKFDDALTKEPTMAINAPLFETKTFINGQDATDMSVEQIFGIISQAEARIEQLNKIEHKPKALKDEIERLQLGLQNIVTFVDGRS